MFQKFGATGDGSQGGARLARLRAAMSEQGLDGFMVPRADAHQGEYIADSDARLRWLTGFSGSAGQAIVTADKAGVFVDGRYRVQVKEQVDLDHFTPVDFPETRPADWLREALPDGGRVGFDPWLHTHREIEELRRKLEADNISFLPVDNPVDQIWSDRPDPPTGKVRLHDDAIAGASAAEKRRQIAAELRRNGQDVAILTLADSIAWLLNIRGSDLPHNPVVLGFAAIESDGTVQLFADPAKFRNQIRDSLGDDVSVIHPDGFAAALANIDGTVRVDPATAPEAVFQILIEQDTQIIEEDDPVILPKARKNEAEIEGMRAAHLTDGAAMARFLAWLDATAPGGLTEIDVVTKLEEIRRAAGILDISFETICGVGPHAALPHYRVSHDSNAAVEDGKVLLVDSGGQYPNGTTDITRTLAIGDVGQDARRAFTLVLQGMIAVSRLRFPKGVSGRDIDPVARAPLWSQGLDFDHGTGHGVGAALCVHEGPARISRVSEIPLETGMILSNEPGYYREGEFGIRTENLLVVVPADSPDGREMLGFETLNFTPINRRMIEPGILSPAETEWLNAYHAQVLTKIGPLVDDATREWLEKATAPV